MANSKPNDNFNGRAQSAVQNEHAMTADEAVNALGTDALLGLTDKQAQKKLDEFGENVLAKQDKKPLIIRFLQQFKDAMIIILLIASAVSFALCIAERKAGGFFEPALILLIVILNAVIGVLQESKAQKALDALKSLSAPHAKAVRGGGLKVIPASELVPGDIIRLEAGDFVPADARLIKSVSLKSEESALTGESVPAEKNAHDVCAKDAPLGDRTNMVFSGCSISYGTADAVVTKTGMSTEMGKIAGLLKGEKETLTPLQQKLADLGKKLGFIALAACAVIFIVGIINGVDILEMVMTSVSLAVSAIPEGLPAVVTVVLSIGVRRMARKNAIIRSLPAVETLGSASVICSDKTGTLTQNRMTLVSAYTDGEKIEDISENNSQKTVRLLKYASLCCDGSITVDGDSIEYVGDPTETAIIYAAYINGFTKDALNAENPRMAEIPFDSDRKLMTTVNVIGGKNIVIVKGAFDILSARCISGGIDAAVKVNNEMSEKALRVIAVAYKEINVIPDEPSADGLENGLTFMGLLGMIDPPRPEAKEAVAVCKNAGIKPVMITGDHIVTASAIGRGLGILDDSGRAITGAELDKLGDGEFAKQVEDISVYARVSPENKIRIVKAWQTKGEVVSMTGDGVNDAPALKAADIGCAMGITGTDVAKGAADMTLTDDNFSTIVHAVREGRGIYDNIKKVVGYLLGTNIGEVLCVFFAMILWHKSPFLSTQLLWINLVTDSLPAITLGMEPVEPNVMKRKPKPKNESIFAHGLGVRIVLQGCMFAVLSLISFVIGESITGLISGGRTLAFMVLGISQTLQAFNMRSERSLLKTGIFTNKMLNLGALASLLLMAIVLFTPLSIPFGLVILPARGYLIGLGLCLAPTVIMEISKAAGLIKHSGR